MSLTYINKGKWLFDAIAAAGYRLAFVNGQWSYNLADEAAIQNIINTFNPLPLAQADAIKQINAAVQVKLAKVTAAYPDLEVSTWPQQMAEAQAFTANAAASTPMLSAIATASNQTVAVLASAVLAKAAAYTVESGTPVGQRQLYTAQVQAATDWTLIAGITTAALTAIGV